jgi:hypothetical protein
MREKGPIPDFEGGALRTLVLHSNRDMRLPSTLR